MQESEQHLKAPLELIEACTAGECVLFASTGLSAQAGLPTACGFYSDLLQFALAIRQTVEVRARVGASLRLEAYPHPDENFVPVTFMGNR
jgi:hypothetical protein